MPAALVEYARVVHARGTVQVGQAFTDIAEADTLIRTESNAFLLGVLFTQGIRAERAWAGPYLLRQRLGHLDVDRLASEPTAVADAVARPPALHRFVKTMPQWISAASQRLLDRYAGDAGAIWPDGSSVLQVVEELTAFPGIGRKKAAMATEILARHLGVRLVGMESGTVAYDVHVRRVFLRSGLATSDDAEVITRAAAEVHPEEPGFLDLPAWLIGREWCRPRVPRCGECPLGVACPKLLDFNPAGVG